jgi:outer membrane protein assembly factor BamD (BamD/ComL family)
MFKGVTQKFFIAAAICLVFLSIPGSLKSQDNVSAQEAKSATSIYNEGLNLLREKDFKNGYTMMESALAKAKEENNNEVYTLARKNVVAASLGYGNELLKLKNTKEAIVLFNRGLELDSMSTSLQMSLSRAKEESGDIDGAANMLISMMAGAKAENDAKKSADIESRLKNMLLKQLNAKAYAKVIKIGTDVLGNNKSPEIAYLVGKAHVDKGDLINGIKYLSQSIESSTAAGEKIEDKVYYAIGLAYDSKKDSKNAIKYLSLITDAKYKPAAQATIARLKG